MGKVIYLTGAPATGKSTLCSKLAASAPSIRAFCYSERLRDHVGRDIGVDLNETDIRRESARVVTARHVEEVDYLLQQEVVRTRTTDTHLIIDSHPVARESYGFRVTPFPEDCLRALKIDFLFAFSLHRTCWRNESAMTPRVAHYRATSNLLFMSNFKHPWLHSTQYWRVGPAILLIATYRETPW